MKKIAKVLIPIVLIATLFFVPLVTTVTIAMHPFTFAYQMLISVFHYELPEMTSDSMDKMTGGKICSIFYQNNPTLKEEIEALTENKANVNRVALIIIMYGLTDISTEQIQDVVYAFENNPVPDDALNCIKSYDFIKQVSKKPPDDTVLEALKSANALLSGGASNIAGLTIRNENPKYDPANPYFFSDMNIFYKAGYAGQCTWYAEGRIMEMANEIGYDLDYDALYTMTGNGGDWVTQAYTRQSTFEISYDVSEARAGSVMCWGGGWYDGYPCGHVAVVEKVNDDGTIAMSEGWYSGGEIQFRYLDNVTADSILNRSSYGTPYVFRGYIHCIAVSDETNNNENNEKTPT